MTTLGVILARGGSKRIPGKNLRLLGGRPLIAWTILAAQNAKLIDAVVLSSDDDAILAEAARWSCRTVRRPAEMAADDASPYPAVLHAMLAVELGLEERRFCLLQPTSPFRTAGDIDACLSWALVDARYCPWASTNPGWNVPNGAIYVGFGGWLENELALHKRKWPFEGDDVGLWVMDPSHALDIDTEEHWQEAERMMAERARHRTFHGLPDDDRLNLTALEIAQKASDSPKTDKQRQNFIISIGEITQLGCHVRVINQRTGWEINGLANGNLAISKKAGNFLLQHLERLTRPTLNLRDLDKTPVPG